MTKIWTPGSSRRDFLKMSAAAGAAGAGLLPLAGGAQNAPLNYYTWSAAVDLVKSHLTAFEAKTGLKVNYSNAPWAQYRDTMVTKFVGKAPIDALWVSDSWLPEWADAGWIAPIDGYPELMKYNEDVDDFCVKSMQYKGKQYGLTYYSDYMAFFYDEEMLKKAGIKAPPQTWDEVVQQSADDQESRPVAVPADALDGPRELAGRVPHGPGVFQRRPLHRRQRRGADGRSQARRAAGAHVGHRRRQQAQDRLAGVRRDRRAERPQVASARATMRLPCSGAIASARSTIRSSRRSPAASSSA